MIVRVAFSNMAQTFQTAKRLVAEANRLLYMEGLLTNVGHVSHRDPSGDYVHINPHSESRGEVWPEDITEVTLDSERRDGAPRPVGETPIHTSIYRARDDINAVLHLHPPISTLLPMASTELQPMYFRSALFEGPIEVYDRPDKISTNEDGDALVHALDGQNQIMVRGHGSVVADRTMQRAFARAMFMEKNAYYQMYATMIGEPSPLTEEEIERNKDDVFEDRSVQKVWHYYLWKARENGYIPPDWDE